MLYAFFLFWPANVLPLYLLIALLQIYIPLNILIRSLFMKSDQYPKHKLASLIIMIAVVMNSFVLLNNWERWGIYYLLFLGSAAFDVMSHGLKESLVRGVPINQGKFNLNISVAQLVAGIILSPILLAISYKYDTYGDDSPLGALQEDGSPFSEFYIKYISLGFQCAFNFNDDANFNVTQDDGTVLTDVC